MSADVATPPRTVRDTENPTFFVNVCQEDAIRVVRVAGDLDIAARHDVFIACVTREGTSVMVDLGDTTFMDCSGYGTLIAARRVLEEQDRSLTWRNATDQPADFLRLIAEVRQRGSIQPGADGPSASSLRQ